MSFEHDGLLPFTPDLELHRRHDTSKLWGFLLQVVLKKATEQDKPTSKLWPFSKNYKTKQRQSGLPLKL